MNGPGDGVAGRGGERGVSLHIGLNEVDPAHYAGWRGTLNACEFDAEDMRDLAERAGFETRSLIRGNATRANVLAALADVAAELREGDIFFISYAGHGGQVPDYSGDEDDRKDETWCLYDGQLIDDELLECWNAFAGGVRILIVSDSCHSGSVYRSLDGRLTLEEPPQDDSADGSWAERPRTMNNAIAARVYRQNRDFYDNVQRELYDRGMKKSSREEDFAIAATLRHLSGCMDHQFSFDGVANGHFTERLLFVWNNGRFSGDYATFHSQIRSSMRADQTSCHASLGPPMAAYDQQRPFTI